MRERDDWTSSRPKPRHSVAEARADHASHPQRLWLLGRSPLRTALHLRTRAAVRADDSACPIPLLDAPVLMRLAIASDHRVPAATLAELARDPDVEVRRWVAGNVATPPVALAKLARDPDPEVRRTVAWNDAIPPAALAELARDPDPDVRRTVARTDRDTAGGAGRVGARPRPRSEEMGGRRMARHPRRRWPS